MQQKHRKKNKNKKSHPPGQFIQLDNKIIFHNIQGIPVTQKFQHHQKDDIQQQQFLYIKRYVYM